MGDPSRMGRMNSSIACSRPRRRGRRRGRPRAQQGRFGAFCREYNDVRPHESLDNQPPATVYQRLATRAAGARAAARVSGPLGGTPRVEQRLYRVGRQRRCF